MRPLALCRELFDRQLAAAYSEHLWFRKLVRAVSSGPAPRKWIFLVGCYNSGTTILKKMIASHPDIATLPKEGVRYAADLAAPEELGWSRMWVRCEGHVSLPPVVDQEMAERVRLDWSPWFSRSAECFLEKSITNVARLEWLSLNFPNAYFVGIVRNGYCACEGIRRRAVPSQRVGGEILERYPWQWVGEQWCRANEKMLDASRRISNFHLLKYEDFARSPHKILGEIWEFLNVHTPEMQVEGDALTIEGKPRIIKDMNKNSIDRLSAEDISNLNAVIGPLMVQLGYDLL